MILQPHLAAATAIRRVANLPHRKPETRAAMTLAASLLLTAEVLVEWNLIHPDGRPWLQPWSDDESLVRDEAKRHEGWPVVNRIRVTVPPMVEDYQPAPHLAGREDEGAGA